MGDLKLTTSRQVSRASHPTRSMALKIDPPAVRSLYRQILHLCKNLPAKQRAMSIREVQKGFRSNMGCEDATAQMELMMGAREKLTYLEMVVPAYLHRKEHTAPDRQKDSDRYKSYVVSDDGKVVEGRGKLYGSSNVTRLRPGVYTVDPDHVRRNEALVKREQQVMA